MLSYIVPGGNKSNFTESNQRAYEALATEPYADQTPLSFTSDQISSQPTNGLSSPDVNGDNKSYSLRDMNSQVTTTSYVNTQQRGFSMNGDSYPGQQLLEDQSPAPSEPLSISSDLLTPGSEDKSIIKSTSSSKPGLKRVSFGSSKGSMVETLIYDSPAAEEERIPEEEPSIGGAVAADPVAQKLVSETPEAQKAASRVRVTFFECEKPLAVTSPEPPDLHCFTSPLFDFGMTSSPGLEIGPSNPLDRQLSTDSGRDNPFRPDGDISKEADEIVQRIKAGQPLNGSVSRHNHGNDATDNSLLSSHSSPYTEPLVQASTTTQVSHGVNGTSSSTTGADPSSPGPVEVKHSTVSPSDPAQVEHVVLKKKNKRHCCVLQ